MLPPLDVETLAYLLAGGAGGALVATGTYLLRDWRYVLRKWRARTRPEPLAESDDDSTYHAFAVADEERRKLPRTIAWIAGVGATATVAFKYDTELFLVIPMIIVGVVAILRAVLADTATTIEIDGDGEVSAPPSGRRRLEIVGNELATLVALALGVLLLPVAAPVREFIGVSDNGADIIFFGGFLILIVAEFTWKWFKEPEEDFGEYTPTFDDGHQGGEALLMTLGTIVLAIMIVTLWG